VLRKHGVACRIYAPVGHHSDLLAYLVRRLLENGANSSFVNQIFDAEVPVHVVAADPFEKQHEPGPKISLPADIFASERPNSKGFDLSNPEVLAKLQAQRARRQAWSYGDLGEPHPVHSPTTGDQIGQIRFLSADQARQLAAAATPWQVTAAQRAAVLRKAANLYESHAEEFFALLTHEAGKTLSDCISELREAVDFLRYYAHQAEALDCSSYGVFTCISPWNFPLAIFTGQIAAALAMGNGVLAKPAEATSLIAMQATALLHQAGIPKTCLQLLPGQGATVGPVVCGAPNVSGVCFTGSTKTAQAINQVMADNLKPHAPLIAETGGLNAMIVDSTALLEQAVQDVVYSAFQSAGQRCSALRMLYVQSDIADAFERMLCGAMQALVVGPPEDADCDVGPVIDAAAQRRIAAHIANHKILFQTSAPENGYFVIPTILSVSGMSDLHEEIFGPVLHLARYDASDLDRVIDDINASGYGLTFGFHSRIDDRVQKVVSRVNVGNLYINRNQIGAVVGSQPFGGHGLSGTGPKAGGPCYLPRFAPQKLLAAEGPLPPKMDLAELEQAFAAQAPKQSHTPKVLPGPTGESNRYLLRPRSRVLCMGLGAETRAQSARDMGCCAIAAEVTMSDVTKIPDLQAVVYAGPQAQALRQALSARHGAIVPLLMDEKFKKWLVCEQSICINTTAAGGNTALLAS
jgi:RHH-type proline utilization regulon transcriptional repressor/proline dehydrogenase/delta 1-pyrroline-5-carboxylate dehydrogenase